MVSEKELASLWEIAGVVAEMEPHVLHPETGQYLCEFCEYTHANPASCLTPTGAAGNCDQYHHPRCVYLLARRLVAPDIVESQPRIEMYQQRASGVVPLAVLQELVDRLFAPESQI